MSEARIDVQVEHKHAPPPPEKTHPNTCPKCGSHYRDDELEATLWVCGHCGHHFPMRARARIDWYTDAGSFVEEAADVRSEDPLDFFDLRPYAERLSEAELNTGLTEAALIGQATIDGHPVELSVMDFTFMGGSMGSAVGEKFSRACDSAIERGVPLVSVTSSGGALAGGSPPDRQESIAARRAVSFRVSSSATCCGVAADAPPHPIRAIAAVAATAAITCQHEPLRTAALIAAGMGTGG